MTGVVVCQLVTTHYRRAFVEALAAEPDPPTFIVGDEHFEAGPHGDVHSPLVERVARNRFLFGRRLVYQCGTLSRLAGAEVAVIELNPRILNNWLVLIVRRVRGRATLTWGHAFPRKGAASGSGWARAVLRRLASGVVVYTDAEREALRDRLPDSRLWVAPNALYSAACLMRQTPPVDVPFRLLVIGRLAESKRPNLALEAFRLALPQLPPDVVLTMVGDGPMAEDLRAWALRPDLRDRVEMPGQITEFQALGRLFSQAIVTVATGYVGLNAVQSLGFGVPVLYPQQADHAPEVSLLNERNSRPYGGLEPSELAEALVRFCAERAHWRKLRSTLATELLAVHTVDRMVSGFMAAVRAQK